MVQELESRIQHGDIRNIAAKAGRHYQTVRNYLQGRKVTPATETAILKAAADLFKERERQRKEIQQVLSN